MDNTQPTRFAQRFQNYQKILRELRAALDLPAYSTLERAGLIHLFECSFELAWKSMKDLLIYEGFDAQSPRAVIKQAFAVGYITQGDTWLEALEGRNLFTHTYDGALAEDAVALIKNKYAALLFALELFLQKRQPCN